MKTFIIIMLIFGIFEIISNLFHLSKGSKEKIGESAKKQHQELPMDIDSKHFFYKAVIMFILGLLFLCSGLLFFLYNKHIGIQFISINCAIMSLYGFIQAIIYYRCIKVWTALLVYSIPLIFLWILIYQ
jgi:hypothetical protein